MRKFFPHPTSNPFDARRLSKKQKKNIPSNAFQFVTTLSEHFLNLHQTISCWARLARREQKKRRWRKGENTSTSSTYLRYHHIIRVRFVERIPAGNAGHPFSLATLGRVFRRKSQKSRIWLLDKNPHTHTVKDAVQQHHPCQGHYPALVSRHHVRNPVTVTWRHSEKWLFGECRFGELCRLV